MKVVLNKCFGGFDLSDEAKQLYADLSGKSMQFIDDLWKLQGSRELTVFRSDPNLVKVVETLGERADTKFSSLKIVEIPDGIEWHIQEYDGNEWVAENHRTWR